MAQILSQSGVYDASGNVSLSFGAPGLGLALVGSLTAPSAPSGAAWEVQVAGIPAGSWKGDSAFGPIATEGNATVTVTGSGGTPGATATVAWHVTQYCGSAPAAYPQPIANTMSGVSISGGNVTATLAAGSTVAIDTSGGPVPVTATGTVVVTSITDPVTVGSITNIVNVDPGTVSVVGVAGGQTIGIAGQVTFPSAQDVTVTSGNVTITSGAVTATLAAGSTVAIDTSGGPVPVTATGTVVVTSITDPVTVGSITNIVNVDPGTVSVVGVAGGQTIGIAGQVTFPSAQDVTVTSGNVTITSGAVTATLAAGSTVAIDTSGGPVPVTATGTVVVTSITDPVTVGSITNIVNVDPGTVSVVGVAGGQTIGIAGQVTFPSAQDVTVTSGNVTITSGAVTATLAAGSTVDINNVAGGTIDINTIAGGNQLGAQAVEDNPIPNLSAPTVTQVGTAGTTTHHYQQSLVNGLGETVGSPVTTTTTSNATLSGTNYNNVAVQGLVVPSGIGGNLVYDSNLTNAIASTGATWALDGATIGTAAGDFNVLNPGSSTAEWVIYGSGVTGVGQGVKSQLIDVIPGQTYTVSSLINASAATSGYGELRLAEVGGTINLSTFNYGTSGLVSASMTIPAGITQVFVELNQWTLNIPIGSVVSFSQIQLTQTNTVRTYQPGPLWTVKTFRDGYHVPALDTTLLVASDQGQAAGLTQPTWFNSTGQQLQVSSSEIDNVLSPITRMLGPSSDGNTFFSGYLAPIDYVSAADPPDYFAAPGTAQWYTVLGKTAAPITAPALLKSIEWSGSGNPLYMMLFRANGTTMYLGNGWSLASQEWIDLQLPIVLYPGDRICLGSSVTASVGYILFGLVDL